MNEKDIVAILQEFDLICNREKGHKYGWVNSGNYEAVAKAIMDKIREEEKILVTNPEYRAGYEDCLRDNAEILRR